MVPELLSTYRNGRRLLPMKSLAAVAIIVGVVAMPAGAQHGGSHGGFSGHSGSMGHSAPMGHFSAPMSRPAPMGHFAPPMSHFAPPVSHFAPPVSRPAPVGHFAPGNPGFSPGYSRGVYPGRGPARFGGPVPVNQRRLPYTGANRGLPATNGDRGRRGGGDHHRRPYYRGWGLGYSYGYPGFWPGYPFLNSWCILGCDAGEYGDYDNPSGYAAGYGAPGAAYGQPDGQFGDAVTQYPGYPVAPDYNYGGGEPYPPTSGDAEAGSRAANSPQPVSNPPAPQQPLQVILKDGQKLQVHNYMLTSTTLTVLDDNYRQIPLDQIDLNATRQTNQANGIDFRVPHGPHEATPGQLHPGAKEGETPTPRNQLS
jgi:hypothetical protein